MAIFEPLYEWDYLSPTPKLTPLTAAAPPEITRRRTRVDDPAEARHPLHRRPGVQGQAARARRRGLRLFVQALARSERAARRPAGPHRPHPRRAAGGRSRQEDRQVRFRRADRGPPRARSLHAADPDERAQLSEHPRHAELRRRRPRAKSSRRPGPTCARAPSAPARSASRNGSAAPASSSRPTPAIARRTSRRATARRTPSSCAA